MLELQIKKRYFDEAIELLNNNSELCKQYKKLNNKETIYFDINNKCLTNKLKSNTSLAVFPQRHNNCEEFREEFQKVIIEVEKIILTSSMNNKSGDTPEERFAITHHQMLRSDIHQ